MVTLGAMPRKMASYVRTVPDAALAPKVDCATSNSSRRKPSCPGDGAGAGGRTSRTKAPDETGRSGGDKAPSYSSSMISVSGRFGPPRSRSTAPCNLREALLDAAARAAWENIADVDNIPTMTRN